MTHGIHPFHIIVIAFAGWLNRQQQAIIDWLIEESRAGNLHLSGEGRVRYFIRTRQLPIYCWSKSDSLEIRRGMPDVSWVGVLSITY